MEVLVAEKAGFCFGVKRAIQMTEEALLSQDKQVYSLGPLVHNSQIIKSLSEQGLKEVEEPQDAEGETLIIRSHGVGPEVLAKAYQCGCKVINATCPFVSKTQEKAHNLSNDNDKVIVVGDREHPEVQGIVGWARGKALVIQNPEEAMNIDKIEKAGVVAQTTQSLSNFQAVVDLLVGKCKEIKVYNTICQAAVERQQAAVDLAKRVDLMIVVGGANSANTSKLTKMCRETGVPTYQVENALELDGAWFKGVKKAGLTAGASTPAWIIEEVKKRMMEVSEVNNVEEGMEEAVEVKTLRPGEIVKGVVVQVGQDEVLIDVGAKSEGVIPLKELSSNEITDPQEVVKVGDEIEVLVLKPEDNEGRMILSKEKADVEKAWQKLEMAYELQQPVEGRVLEVVKGGLLVDVGVRAFIPASLVERGYVEDLSSYVGSTILVKVIELNRNRKKVILSRKAILEEEYARRRQEVLAELKEGQVLKGIVRRLTQFGAFVDIGGIDGLLHISEMSWHRINYPSEVVKISEEIEVMVLKVDQENEKVSLGLKQVLPNPWDNIEEKYPVGNIIQAKVVRLAPFGAFVQLEPGVEGLVHISHLADHHVVKPEEVVSEGEEVNVKVISISPGEKRIRLSIREVIKEGVHRARNYLNKNADNKELTIGDVYGELFDSNKQ